MTTNIKLLYAAIRLCDDKNAIEKTSKNINYMNKAKQPIRQYNDGTEGKDEES